jgi:glutamyl-tRNA synthetase
MLLAWLQVRAAGGVFVLRIEDVDAARTVPGSAQAIVDDLRRLGFDWDEGPDVSGPHAPYLQSARTERYRECVRALDRQGLVYACACSRAASREGGVPDPESGETPYPGRCAAAGWALPAWVRGEEHPARLGAAEAAKSEEQSRSSRRRTTRSTSSPCSLRFRLPPGEIRWHDGVRGPSAQDPHRVCGDFILWTKQDEPSYQLACVADDIAMQITDVLRGADLVASTARQIALHRAFHAEPPRYHHVPLLLGDDGQRLSKSRGSPAIGELLDEGRDPRAILGALAGSIGLPERPAWPRELVAAWVARSLRGSLRDRVASDRPARRDLRPDRAGPPRDGGAG